MKTFGTILKNYAKFDRRAIFKYGSKSYYRLKHYDIKLLINY